MKKSIAVLAGSGLLLLGGCAPVVFAGAPGGGLALDAGRNVQFSQCSLMLGHSPEAARLGIRSPAIQMGALRNQIVQIQHRVSYGFAMSGSRESWRRVASGEC